MSQSLKPDLPKVGRVIPNPPRLIPSGNPSALGIMRPTIHALPQRIALPHAPPSWIGAGERYFITICGSPRNVNQFARDETWQVIVRAVEYYDASGTFHCRLFLAMPDHIHALMAFPPGEQMSHVLRNWKRYVAKNASVNWQDGFFDHRLRREESLEEKAGYIRANPVRAGLVQSLVEWPYVWTDSGIGAAD